MARTRWGGSSPLQYFSPPLLVAVLLGRDPVFRAPPGMDSNRTARLVWSHHRLLAAFDAEIVEHLAFEPVGASMDVHCGLRSFTIRDHGLYADALIAREAVYDVDQIEALGAVGILHRRDV